MNSPPLSIPLLSVCVPTYNRAALLSEALAAVLGQITPDMADRVEVVVLDNASPDDTPGVVARAQAQFPHAPLRHVRRPQNVGPDANFCDAPRQARGEFVYLLSDDDVLLPGAIETLLTLIDRHPDFDAFALNVRDFWERPDEEAMELAFRLERDACFTGRDQALALLKLHVTFLSCIAFRRENVRGRDYTPYHATNLAQSYMFLDALAPGRGLYATRAPFLSRRHDNNEGFDFFRVFATNFAALMRYALSLGYRPETVRDVSAQSLVNVYSFVLMFKSRGRYGKLTLSYPASLAAIWRLLRTHGFDRFLLLMVIPRLLVPSAVFVQTQRLYTGAKARLKARRGGSPEQPRPEHPANKV